MDLFSQNTVLVFAFAIGIIGGFAVRRAKLCTFGALESLLFGGDARRVKAIAAGLGIAIAITQALILTGLLNVQTTPYISAAASPLAIALGGTIFGFGMALVGTCAFGCLVRLGGGDLRSLVAILLTGAVAFASLYGTLVGTRLFLTESLPSLPPVPADLPTALELVGLGGSRIWVSAAIACGLLIWALSDRRLWAARRLLVAGAALGLLVAAGWMVTGVFPDTLSSGQMPQSLTFIAPLAKLPFGVLYAGETLAAFGTMTAFGVIIGSFISALVAHDFRWEAFDAHQEMQRHLLGASLMGFGGALAGGCTIGQGLTAGSLLALSWPFALSGIVLGAWFGTFLLIGGWYAMRGWIRARIWGVSQQH
jgi:uncharacterized membrane protein YedE/YeeE